MAQRKKRKDRLAVALGRRGGKARVSRMTPEELREHARRMVQAREANRRAHGKSGPHAKASPH